MTEKNGSTTTILIHSPGRQAVQEGFLTAGLPAVRATHWGGREVIAQLILHENSFMDTTYLEMCIS